MQTIAAGGLVTAPADMDAEISDRRRPGRAAASPHLVPLLRGQAEQASGLADDGDPSGIVPGSTLVHDDLGDPAALARGILWGLAISLPCWAGIAALCWAVF